MTEKEKHKYMFPNFMAKAMKNVSQQVQYEATMMSIFMILLGLIASAIYSTIYFDVSLVFKIIILVNAFFAFIFLSSALVTTYQQYTSYLEAIEIFKPTEEVKENV